MTMDANSHDSTGGSPESHAPHAAPHIMPMGQYMAVFAGLILLTTLTVALSFVEMHQAHLYVGLLIASAKAALVILFFMHVLHAHRLIWSAAIAAMLFLGILIVLTMSDYLARGWLNY